MATTPRRERGAGSIEVRPSGRYRVRWYTRDGRHPSRTFTTRQDAERFLRRAIVDSEREGLDIAPKSATVASLIGPWWATTERSVKPRTAERYDLHRRLIEQRFGGTRLRELDYEAVQAFIDQLSVEYMPRTVSAIYGVLSLILKDAQRRGKLQRAIPKPILPRVAKPKLTVPTRDDVEALALANDARLFSPVILTGYCGLREGELLGLQRKDIHLDDGYVFVHQARNKSTGRLEGTKTDSARRVYLPDRVRDTLAEHLAEYPSEPTLVTVSASVLQKSWATARAACCLQAVRFHDLRHAAASMMIHAGWSVTQVAKQLGHADPAMTLRIYSHLWPDSHEDAIRKMNEYIAHD